MVFTVFENKEKMVLVMEIAAGGELYDFLSERKCLEENEARRIFRQIATAVYYCHKHNICHRDLKLENILLDENGCAKVSGQFTLYAHKNSFIFFHSIFLSNVSLDCRFRLVKCLWRKKPFEHFLWQPAVRFTWNCQRKPIRWSRSWLLVSFPTWMTWIPFC